MNFFSIFTYTGRTGLYLSCIKRKKMVKLANYKLKKRGIFISNPNNIGENFVIGHPVSIVIGDKVIIGDNVKIYQCVTIGQKNNKYPRIGNNVVIYPNSVIVGDITIGDNCIIGAGSVVISSIPNNCVAAGNPARVIKKLEL